MVARLDTGGKLHPNIVGAFAVRGVLVALRSVAEMLSTSRVILLEYTGEKSLFRAALDPIA